MYIVNRVIGKIIHLFIECCSNFGKTLSTVYMLHNIGGENGDIYNLSIPDFELFLTKLKKYEVVDIYKCKYLSLSKAVITFDDVPSNFYDNAFPILVKYNYPFTLFISTSLVDTPGYLSSEQLLELSTHPLCTIGSHGVNHCEYRLLSSTQIEEELIYSKNYLSTLLNREISVFAFPYGSFSACGFSNKSIVCGVYDYGFSSVQASIKKHGLLPNYFLPRINVTRELISTL